jgi:pimeloyl-ACP methyl ester carboxylesterase
VLVPDFLRAGPASVAVASTRVMRGDMREMMHAIRVPTLLVWGENDPLVPLPFGQAMQQEIEGSRLAVIPSAAHVSMWDAPDEFNGIALEFFDEVEAAAPGDPSKAHFSWGIAGWTPIGDFAIAHRQAGRRRDIVLIHGLGLSSAYFERLASALFADGWNPIAPDLPGFGESPDARAGGPEEHAGQLAQWADALGIREAVWLGHSIGSNAVAHLARKRPDLVKGAMFIGPLWTRSRHPQIRTLALLALDAFREPLSLYSYVITAYWRTGIARWWNTARRYANDIGCGAALPPDSMVIAGVRDPIPDRTCVEVQEVPGAHACVYSHPHEVGEVLNAERAIAPLSLEPRA